MGSVQDSLDNRSAFNYREPPQPSRTSHEHLLLLQSKDGGSRLQSEQNNMKNDPKDYYPKNDVPDLSHSQINIAHSMDLTNM
jgi:hypothetical protein